MSFFSHKKPVLAIDITRDVIRMVYLDNHTQIQYLTSIPTPSEAFVNDRIMNAEALATVLRDAIKKIQPSPKEIIFGIPESLCFNKLFSIDAKTDEKSIQNTITELARNTIPLELEKSCWDYVEQKNNTQAASKSFFYISTDRQVVESYQKIAQICGLSIRAIDSNALALSRAFLDASNNADAPDNGTMILNGNTPHIMAHIFNTQGVLVFSGIIPLIDIQKITEVASLQNITSELTTMMQYVETSLHIKTSRIIVAGELALVPSIETLFPTLQGTSITLGDPTKPFSTSSTILKKEPDSLPYSVALGLALHDPENTKQTMSMNFIGREMVEQKKPLSQSEIPTEKSARTIPYKKILAYLFIVATFIVLGVILYHYLLVPLSTR